VSITLKPRKHFPPPPGRPTQVRWLIFVLACLTSWLLYLHRYSWGVVKPALKQEYHFTDVELGWLDAVFMATYGFGQVPGGLAGDVWGPHAVLTLLILLWSCTIAALAVARSFLAMAGVRAVFGLAQAGTYPCLSQVTRTWFPLSVRTTVQGAIATLSGRAGAACASLVVASLLMGLLHLSWRQAMVAIGGLGALLGVSFWFLFRNRPREHPWANEAEQQLIDEGSPPAPSRTRPRLHLTGPNVLNLVALLVYAFTSTFADMLYLNWIPLYLTEGKGLTPMEMGVFASLPLWGGALGGAVGGVLNDTLIRVTGSRRVGRSAVAYTGKLMAGVLIATSIVVADGRWVMVVLGGCKFFGDWGLPTQWGTTTDIGGRASGTVFGVVNTVGAVAAILAGPVMGWIKGYYGWENLFLTVAGVYVLAAACWLFIDCTRRLVVEDDASGESPRL
jgi:sugar phosphate permease